MRLALLASGRISDLIRLNMTNLNKRSSVPRPKAGQVKVDKVSVLLPRSVKQRVARSAKADRRALSPQIVVLIEEGLAAREVAAG